MLRLLSARLYLAPLIALAILAGPVAARDQAAASLTLDVDDTVVTGQWRIPVASLDEPLRLDANRDGKIEWLEIQDRRQDIEDHLAKRLAVVINGNQSHIEFKEIALGTRGERQFIMAAIDSRASRTIDSIAVALGEGVGASLEVPCQLRVRWQGTGIHEAIIVPGEAPSVFSRSTANVPGMMEWVRSGVQHIWIGYDHILFLLVLLVPAVFERTANGRRAADSFHIILIRVIVVVSAFTVAHSVTLTLAALGWVSLPSRLVETAIALSVLLAALHNLLPSTTGVRSAWLALGFGLLHGFGFASVLSEAIDTDFPLWQTLVGFNIGVELGQLVIVAAFLPLAFVLRTTGFYRNGVLYGGSLAACVVSAFWIWERAFPAGGLA